MRLCEFGWEDEQQQQAWVQVEMKVNKAKEAEVPPKRRAAGGPRSGRFSEQARYIPIMIGCRWGQRTIA
ncbi:hypothetical protein ABZX51_006996 [Aspergillus tubingensis]